MERLIGFLYLPEINPKHREMVPLALGHAADENFPG